MKRSTLCLATCLGLSGCAASSYRSDVPRSLGERVPTGAITVYVSNRHFEDMRIYLIRGSTWIPVGTVGSNSVRRLVIPSAQLGPSGLLQLVAQSIGSRASAEPEALDIWPGDEVDFWIEGYLKHSRLLTRVYRPQ